jgi:hypothetical protein
MTIWFGPWTPNAAMGRPEGPPYMFIFPSYSRSFASTFRRAVNSSTASPS